MRPFACELSRYAVASGSYLVGMISPVFGSPNVGEELL